LAALTQTAPAGNWSSKPVGDRRAQSLQRLVGALLGDEVGKLDTWP